MKPGPWRGNRVHVLQGKCSDCVFRAGNKMQLSEGRLADLVESNIAADSALTCHQTLPDWPGEAPPAVCRGFFDGYADRTLPLRLAIAMKLIQFDPTPTPPQRGTSR